MRRWSLATVVPGVLLLSTFVFVAGAGAVTDTTTTTTAKDTPAVETAKPLVTKFFTLIQNKDTAGLKKFMSAAFELERADGSGSNKADYLQNLSTVQSFNLTDFNDGRLTTLCFP